MKRLSLLAFLLVIPLLSLAQPHQTDLFSCVSFVRHNSFWGNFPTLKIAADLPILKQEPRLGSIAIFDYKPDGHLALVAGINYASSTIIIFETNFIKGELSRREISFNDKFLKGYYWY